MTTTTATRLLLLLDRTRPIRRGLGLRDGFIHAQFAAAWRGGATVARTRYAKILPCLVCSRPAAGGGHGRGLSMRQA